MPLATPTTIRTTRPATTNKGGSFDIDACLKSNLDALKEIKARRDIRVEPGNTLKCLVATCGADYPTGGKFCYKCGTNQDVEEVKQLKTISAKLNN